MSELDSHPPLFDANAVDANAMRSGFDHHGYVIVNDALTWAESTLLGNLLDERAVRPGLTKPESRFGSGDFGEQGAGFLSWGHPFASLLHNRTALKALDTVFPDGYRLDFVYGIHMRDGTVGLPLHGGVNFDREHFCRLIDGRLQHGEVVITFNLTQTGPSRGGFRCVPGSHRLDRPAAEALIGDESRAQPITLELRPGSILVFNDALVHGTQPWKSTSVTDIRRSLVFKYVPYNPRSL